MTDLDQLKDTLGILTKTGLTIIEVPPAVNKHHLAYEVSNYAHHEFGVSVCLFCTDDDRCFQRMPSVKTLNDTDEDAIKVMKTEDVVFSLERSRQYFHNGSFQSFQEFKTYIDFHEELDVDVLVISDALGLLQDKSIDVFHSLHEFCQETGLSVIVLCDAEQLHDSQQYGRKVISVGNDFEKLKAFRCSVLDRREDEVIMV